MEIGLQHYLFVAMLLFSLGLFGVLLRRNTLVVFMSLELMLGASILVLIAASRFHATPANPMMEGNLFALFIIAVAACEVAVGLAIIVALWRRQQSVLFNDHQLLKN